MSQATVSRAFTPGASIAPEVRTKILEAAERIGYRPNLVARSLIAGKTRLIGILLSRQTNLLYPELLYELSGRLTDRGYQILLFAVREDEPTREVVERIWSYRVDAVLATGVLEPEDVPLFRDRGIPLIGFNRTFDHPISSVTCDFIGGARDLAARLAAHGARRFGLAAGLANSYVSGEVEVGVRLGLARYPDAQVAVFRSDYVYEAGAGLVDQMRAEPDGLPDAIICVNDTVAAGCLDQLRARKVRIPAQVSVVAFESFAPSHWRSYDIAGVRQPMQEMIGAAVELLMARIEGGREVVERRSYAPILVEGATATL